MNSDGEVCQSLPQFAAVDPNKFGISICTIDGQRFNIGNTEDFFCLQSIRYAINIFYLLGNAGLFYGRRFQSLISSSN